MDKQPDKLTLSVTTSSIASLIFAFMVVGAAFYFSNPIGLFNKTVSQNIAVHEPVVEASPITTINSYMIKSPLRDLIIEEVIIGNRITCIMLYDNTRTLISSTCEIKR